MVPRGDLQEAREFKALQREGQEVNGPRASATVTVGPKLGSMTDDAVLNLFNDVIVAQQAMAVRYDDKLIEIPPGKPHRRDRIN